MMLDMLAAVARKDYEDRRRRQTEGIAAAKAAGAYKGRRPNEERNTAIIHKLKAGQTWSTVQRATGCSRSTLSRLTKQVGNVHGRGGKSPGVTV
jgi:DNA invertase Pin-like site-specific DNA recombinase